jgi:hypothetical protein
MGLNGCFFWGQNLTFLQAKKGPFNHLKFDFKPLDWVEIINN